MELMNMIFENYGGQHIGRIFRNYFSLTLVLQQLMFTFFLLPARQPATYPVPVENNLSIEPVVDSESPDGELNWMQALQLLLTLAQLETEKPLSASETIIQQ